MSPSEAVAWLNGERSMTNTIPQEPHETWEVRIAEADAAMTQQAYWIARAHSEGILLGETTTPEPCRKCGSDHWAQDDGGTWCRDCGSVISLRVERVHPETETK